jgi:hypothetical protein
VTCVPGVTRGAREGQKETHALSGVSCVSKDEKAGVFTCPRYSTFTPVRASDHSQISVAE